MNYKMTIEIASDDLPALAGYFYRVIKDQERKLKGTSDVSGTKASKAPQPADADAIDAAAKELLFEFGNRPTAHLDNYTNSAEKPTAAERTMELPLDGLSLKREPDAFGGTLLIGTDGKVIHRGDDSPKSPARPRRPVTSVKGEDKSPRKCYAEADIFARHAVKEGQIWISKRKTGERAEEKIRITGLENDIVRVVPLAFAKNCKANRKMTYATLGRTFELHQQVSG